MSQRRAAAAGRGSAGPSVGRVERHEWTLVGVVAIAVFALGCDGLSRVMTFERAGGPNTWWDVVYGSLQLFLFNGPQQSADWPLHLQIARLLAPVILIYTGLKAFSRQMGRQLALYSLLFHKRRFVVVCGAGETGFRLARDYCLQSGMRVVVIDSDPMNPLAAELEGAGAIVLHGNAIDPFVLLQARVIYARELFLCTGDDQANIAIAKNVERLTRRLDDAEVEKLRVLAGGVPGSRSGLRCHLCVDTPDLYEVFANHPFFATNSDRYAIRVFNRRETIARNVFQSCAPDLYRRPASREEPPLHVLFVGFEALVRELVLQTALTAHYADFRAPRITIMCPPDCKDLVARFNYRFPYLRQTADVHVVYADPLTVMEQQWRELQQGAPFSVAYVSTGRDVESMLVARRLNRLRRLAGMPMLNFVVLLNQQTFLAEILDDNFLPIDRDKSLLPEFEPIEYFETLDETITIDMVVNEALDVMAEALHLAYVEAQTRAGDTPERNPSLLPWRELPPHKKRANQNAAAHMEVKLRIAGYRLLHEAGGDAADAGFPADAAMLETLAQIEHRRWMADKWISGYTRGATRDDYRMLHPDLIPWEELTEPDREKDRNNVRQIVPLARMVGRRVLPQVAGSAAACAGASSAAASSSRPAER